jgi:hypothetical protein
MKAGIQAVRDETRRDAAALPSCQTTTLRSLLHVDFCLLPLDFQAARGRQGAAPDSPLSVPPNPLRGTDSLQQQHQSRWIGSKVPTQLSSVRSQIAVSSACRYSLVTLLSIDMLSFVRSSPRKASKTQTLPAIDTDDPHSSLTASSPLFRNIEGGGRKKARQREGEHGRRVAFRA